MHNDERKWLVLRYAQLAMRFAREQTSELHAKLIEIEEELGMTDAEIMKQALKVAQRA